jgi:hypothetical protein
MATKKKASKKKQTRSRSVARNRATSKTKADRKQSVRSAAPKKKTAKLKASSKRAAVKTRPRSAKAASKKSAGARKDEARQRKRSRRGGNFPPVGLGARSGGQSGDLQGLSDAERANSESVDELLEEGNALEAGIVAGVEEADGEDEREVHTHEVPEDDVPAEYLDEE